jgi:DMSO/TMAO reductase YedYZ molybdopterin-dependent catalytic subunit
MVMFRLPLAAHTQTLLAYEMNYEPLGELHGAPLRLRVENQLGFKMVKWIRAIEFVHSPETVSQGEGGYNEDHEYFGELANMQGGSKHASSNFARGSCVAVFGRPRCRYWRRSRGGRRPHTIYAA